MDEQIEWRLNRCRALPSPPTVAAHLIEIANDPEAELAQLADAIATDPALTAKILRVANSPLYARHRKSANLRQALSLLGLDTAVVLSLSFSLPAPLNDDGDGGLDVAHLWRRSLLGATAAKELGRSRARNDLEELFLCGLLQYLGMLALERIEPGIYGDAGARQYYGAAAAAYERRVLDCDHAQVGAWLLAHWGLPDKFAEAVRDRLNVDSEVSDPNVSEFSLCVAISSYVAEIWLDEAASGASHDGITRLLIRAFDLPEEQVHALMQRVREAIPEIEQLFGTQLMTSVDADLMREQAQELAAMRNLMIVTERAGPNHPTAAWGDTGDDDAHAWPVDPLTGIYNRQSIDDILASEFASANRHGWPVALLIVEIDGFEDLKERHGEAVAGDVLRRLSAVIGGATRKLDIVGRYAEYAFAIVMPGHGTAEARDVGSRILDCLETATHADKQGGQFRVTASVGSAGHESSCRFGSAQDLLIAAYKASREGQRADGAAPDQRRS